MPKSSVDGAVVIRKAPVCEAVKLATRERVLHAAAEMRVADKRSAGLQATKTGPIGLIVADAENPFSRKSSGRSRASATTRSTA